MALRDGVATEAALESHESFLTVRLSTKDTLGHHTMRVEIASEPFTQGHWFEFEIDQSFLPELILQLQAVEKLFPPRAC